MLSTSSRFTQTLDPTTGVARAAATRVSAAVSSTCVSAAGYPSVNAFAGNFDGAWTAIERKPMPMVDLHPDRWPLQSTS